MPKPEEILDFVIRTKAALMQLKGELTRKNHMSDHLLIHTLTS